MSIVERAIGRLESSGKDGKRSSTARVRTRQGNVTRESPDKAAPKRVVSTQDLANRGLLSVADDPALAQSFRFLKRPLLSRVFGSSQNSSSSGHLVMITSDLPGAGKSFVAFNLALSMAQEQMRNVLLVDADPIRRNLTGALGQWELPGLLEVLADDRLKAEDVVLETDLPGLRFLPSGQPHDNSTELLAGTRLVEVLKSLEDADTVVLLDSPPVLLTAEARVLAEKADHSLVVIEAGRTSIADVSAVLKMLGETGLSISFVLNKAPKSSGGSGASYYKHGYGYEY